MHLAFTLRRSPNARHRWRISWRVWYAVVLVGCVVAFLWAAFYIYRNLETSLTSTVDILLLKPQIARESFDPTLFERVLTAFDQKQYPTSSPEWSQLSNPFRQSRPSAGSPPQPENAAISP